MLIVRTRFGCEQSFGGGVKITGRQVAIITDERDLHLAPVVAHLESKPIILDTARIIEGKDLSYEYTRRGSPVVIHQGVPLRNVTSIWYRKPKFLKIEDLPVQGNYRTYSLDSLSNHILNLNTQFENAVWVSDYFAIERARPKAYQLYTAKECGFHTPDTLFTSSGKLAQDFVRHHRVCIVKPLAEKFPRGKFFYTKKISSAEKHDFSGLALAPQIFQEFIQPNKELRITVIGSKVFAAEVTPVDRPMENQQIQDWRADTKLVGFSAQETSLPSAVKKSCQSYIKRLGLKFGAFDFILDKNGNFVFLECNPNGQWFFIEQETGQPMAKAMADLLQQNESIDSVEVDRD